MFLIILFIISINSYICFWKLLDLSLKFVISVCVLSSKLVSNFSCKKPFVTNKYPTKFPLSTVEIYLGSNGVFVFILYQLYKCPFHFSRLSTVCIIFCKRFIPSSAFIKLKSIPEITANRDKPIFVDDVLSTYFCFLSS